MFKRSLFAIAALTLLTTPAGAIEIEDIEWPYPTVPQDSASVAITLDVGYWVRIRDHESLRIKLARKGLYEYSGCTDIRVDTNSAISILCSIQPTGAVPGNWTCSVQPTEVSPPGGAATVCATVKDADLTRTRGGSRNVHVATISIKVVPVL